MSMSDTLADMLTRIRNAEMVRHAAVDVPFSKLKLGVVKILRQEGYINDFAIIEDDRHGVLKITLRYDQENRGAITGIKRISKPGRRMYSKNDQIPKVMSGLGISIISTSQGIMTDRDARRMNVGGEILCQVW